MKKILLAILIITMGLRGVVDCGNFAGKYSMIELETQDEDGKKEKEENKNGKRYSEEIFYHSIPDFSLFNATVMLRPFLSHQEPYFRFTDKPNTPPPNFI